jgi:hypothetical protein
MGWDKRMKAADHMSVLGKRIDRLREAERIARPARPISKGFIRTPCGVARRRPGTRSVRDRAFLGGEIPVCGPLTRPQTAGANHLRTRPAHQADTAAQLANRDAKNAGRRSRFKGGFD